MKLRGCILCVGTRHLEDRELEECWYLIVTSEDIWDPNSTEFEEHENNVAFIEGNISTPETDDRHICIIQTVLLSISQALHLE